MHSNIFSNLFESQTWSSPFNEQEHIIFKAIGFITVVYAISVGFILLAIGSFYGPVDMLVVNYAIAAYIILIAFVLYINGESFKKSRK